jgi:hypothetical protein
MCGWLSDARTPSLLLKARDAIAIFPEFARQDLDCDVAAESRITGAVDLAHTADSQQLVQFEYTKSGKRWRRRRRT